MINVYKNFFIHYSSLIIVACLALKGNFEMVGLVLISVILHELGHIIMLIAAGQQADALVLHAFGISINTHSKSIPYGKMLIIALGGPMFSLILAGISYFVFTPLLLPNLCVGLVNLIPVLPLDGGRVMYIVFSKIHGRKSSRVIMRTIGICIGALAIPIGLALFLTTEYNFSLLLLGLFIIADCFSNPFFDPPSFVRENAVLGEIYIIPYTMSLREAADMLPSDSVGAVVNPDGNVLRLVTAKGLYQELAEISANEKG
ncbi:MAG: site-2 protease family protein [Bacillota bacterium]|nr:site-2 protease family protein [Bacillota bacterium]